MNIYLASFIGDAGEIHDSLVVGLVAAVGVAALAALALAVLVLGARVRRRDTNSGSDLAFVVVPETLLLLSALLRAVFVGPAKVQDQGISSCNSADSLPGVAEVLEAHVIVQPAAVVVLYAGGVLLCVVHAQHCRHLGHFTQADQACHKTAKHFLHVGEC